jgi:hypothetical protein
LCDANSLQSSRVIEASAECTISKGNIDNFSPKDAFMMDTEVLPLPMIISEKKTVDYQVQAAALAHTHAFVPDQSSSMGSEKISFFQALVISYPTSTHVSYSVVITMQSLLTVAPFANFSFNKVAEIVNMVQIDKPVNKVRLGEPPPLIGF